MKKIVIFGGGTSLSQILKGLKLFPLDLTAVVCVSDDGTSTGFLRRDYNIPAVGDISKVLLSMSCVSDDAKELLNYRFKEVPSIKAHSVKNLMLTALLDIKGDFNEALKVMSKILNVNGNVLPLTCDNVDLEATLEDGTKIVGECNITKCKDKKIRINYNKKIKVNNDVISAVKEADLIIFSAGSLLTSVLPHLLDEKLNGIIRNSKAKKMYICNLFTQPGETDSFKVSDHINLIESYLGKNSIDIVIANNGLMNEKIVKKYKTDEQKEVVLLDKDNISSDIILLEENLITVENDSYRHDSLKTSYLIFSYLMDGEKNDVRF